MKKPKTPLTAQAKAVLTKLRLRVNKGFRKAMREVPEAFTPEAHPDPVREAEILKRALEALPKISREELHKRLAGDPGQKAVGDTVFVPFIGSAREEAGLDVKTTGYSLEEFANLQKRLQDRKETMPCPKCLGNGRMSGTADGGWDSRKKGPKCGRCNGRGSVPNTSLP